MIKASYYSLNNMIKQSLKTIGISIVAFLVIIVPVFAQVNSGGSPPRNSGSGVPESSVITNPLKAKTITDLVQLITDIAFQFGAIVAVMMIIFIGFKFVLARGNEKELQGAKNMLLWTVVGIAVLFGSKVLAEIIQATVESLK